jgi:hypothetical protein
MDNSTSNKGNSAAGPDMAPWMRQPEMMMLREMQMITWRDLN